MNAEEQFGRLPDFVVIGAAKAGTTALQAELSVHPKVFTPGQELHFFDKHWEEGVDWYRAQFENVPPDVVCGEKTPSYVTRRLWMERLAKTIPKAKLIMLTRDPVKRLLSHLNMDMRAERLPRTEVLDVDWLRLHILNRPYRFKKYVERGLYLKQIEENVLPFFPRERLLVRSTEETAAAIDRESLVQGKNRGQLRGTTTSDAHASLVGDVCEFLGIDPPPSALNAIRGTRKYVFVVDPEAEQLLVDIYGADEAGSVERTG